MLQDLGTGLIVAIVNFVMVFLVLGGLASVLIGLKHLISYWEARQTPKTPPASTGPSALPQTPQPHQDHQKHLAAVTAALHEFTGQPVGALRIESIEPLAQAPASQNQTLAVITAALHQFIGNPAGSPATGAVAPIQSSTLATPAGAFPIAGTHAIGAVNTWKIAGRLDAVGCGNN